MKKVRKLLGALDELNTAIQEATAEMNGYLIDQTGTQSDTAKDNIKAALRFLKELEKRRSETIKALSNL